MRDLWNLFRGHHPRLAALHYAFEKAGLVLDNQPIPWCAETVMVEAQVDVPAPLSAHLPGDFLLRLADERLPPEQLHFNDPHHFANLLFRFPVPGKSTFAELLWKGRSLGQVALPVLGA